MNPMQSIRRLFRRGPGRSKGRPEDFRILDELLEAESRHLRSVDVDTSAHWRLLQARLAEKGGIRRRAHRAPFRGLRLPRPALGFAVTAALLLVAGLVWLQQPVSTAYETARGQVSTVVLADNSEVTLNHTSELIVDLQPFRDARRVTLKGEAYFRVQKNGKPFVVSTEVGTVRVLGTEFNVLVRDKIMEVAVIGGKVEVHARRGTVDSTVVLTAGEVTTCIQGAFPGTPRRTAYAEYPGWIHGKLLFSKTSLLAVCEEIEARFDVTVNIGKPELRHETVTGSIDGRSADAAITTLAQLTGSRYRYENGTYTLY